jgi:hypothetical protein
MQLRGEGLTYSLGNEIAYNAGEEAPYFTVQGRRRLTILYIGEHMHSRLWPR